VKLTDEEHEIINHIYAKHPDGNRVTDGYIADKRAGMEAAAKVCEAKREEWRGGEFDWVDAAHTMAAAIRRMMDE